MVSRDPADEVDHGWPGDRVPGQNQDLGPEIFHVIHGMHQLEHALESHLVLMGLIGRAPVDV